MFLVKPVVSSIYTSWKDLNQSKESIKSIGEKKQVLEALKSNKDLAQVADIAEKYIPKDQESGQLILELTAIAAANNLKVEQTSLEKSTEAPKAQDDTTTGTKTTATPGPASSPAAPETKNVGFTMKINGTFSDFMNFLKAIEANSRLVTIKNMTMQSKIDATNKTVLFSVQLAGTAYYKDKVSTDVSLDNIKISADTLKTFLNLKTYGRAIDLPAESGFGRTNPFETY